MNSRKSLTDIDKLITIRELEIEKLRLKKEILLLKQSSDKSFTESTKSIKFTESADIPIMERTSNIISFGEEKIWGLDRHLVQDIIDDHDPFRIVMLYFFFHPNASNHTIHYDDVEGTITVLKNNQWVHISMDDIFMTIYNKCRDFLEKLYLNLLKNNNLKKLKKFKKRIDVITNLPKKMYKKIEQLILHAIIDNKELGEKTSRALNLKIQP